MEVNSDITYLLSILHGVDITDSFGDQVIEKWPVDLCTAPINGKELSRRVEEIRQKWVGDDLVSTPVCIPTPTSTPALALTPVFTFAPTPVFASASSTAKKNFDDTCWNDATIISNTKVKIEEANVSTLPSLVTPRRVDQSQVRAAILDDSVVVIDLCESGDETDTQLFETKKISMSNKATPVVNNISKSIKATKPVSTVKSARSKAKKKLDNDNEPNDMMAKICPTLSSTRKRRPAVDYDHVFQYPILDRSDAKDDDFHCDEVDDDDERLDKSFENKWPDLKTPSKRQKKTKR